MSDTRVLAALSEKGCEASSPWKRTYSGITHRCSIRFGSREFGGRVDTLSSLPCYLSHSWTLFGWVLW